MLAGVLLSMVVVVILVSMDRKTLQQRRDHQKVM
jgi:hypothetical protein